MRKTILATVFGLTLATAGTGFLGCGDDNSGGTGGAGGTAGATTDAAAGAGGSDAAVAGAGGSDAAAGAGGSDAAAGAGGSDAEGGTGGSTVDGSASDVPMMMAGKPMMDTCNAGAMTDNELIMNACTSSTPVDKMVTLPGGVTVGGTLPPLQ